MNRAYDHFVLFSVAALFLVSGILCAFAGVALDQAQARLSGAVLILVGAAWLTAAEGADPNSTRRTRGFSLVVALGAFILLMLQIW